MERCCKIIGTYAFQGHRCPRPGSVLRGDSWFCRQHDPEAVRERDKMREDKRQAKREARDKEIKDRQNRENQKRLAWEALRISAYSSVNAAESDSWPQVKGAAKTLQARLEHLKELEAVQ